MILGSNILRINEEDRVGLAVSNLTVSIKGASRKSKKDTESKVSEVSRSNILEDVSFELHSGQLMGIFGGSGSGKTTLLNALSQRLNVHTKSLRFSGQINYSFANDPDSNKKVKNAYLLQTDIFLPGLTVYETLKYQADLRLPPKATRREKAELIDSLLTILELDSVRNEHVVRFLNLSTNLSGGEQRRVSLAIQLLSKPSLLFLDEPTTGLDTSSSLKMMQILKKLASPEFGVTIILSIHQPRPEITVLFDKLCLLTKGGRMFFYGNLLEANRYFGTLSHTMDGFPESRNTSIIDDVMKFSIVDSSTKHTEKESQERINRLVASWKATDESRPKFIVPQDKHSVRKHFEQNVKMFAKNREDKISILREIIVLTERTFITTYRDWRTMLALNGGSAFLGIASGWMFYKPTPDLAGIRSITSCLYVLLEISGFAFAFMEVNRLWYSDGIFFYREYKENYVSIPGFLISRRLAKLFLEDLPPPIILAVITYFMWGLRLGGASFFFIFFVVSILTFYLGDAMATFCFALGPSLPMSSLFMNITYQVQNSACGYFVNAKTMPVYVRWLKYICYFWYAFGALTANQYTGWMGDCPYDHTDPRCEQYSGKSQLKLLGYPEGWVGEPIGILVAWLIGLYLVVWAILKFKNYDLAVAKQRHNTIGGDEVDETSDEEKVNSGEEKDVKDELYAKETETDTKPSLGNLDKIFKEFSDNDIDVDVKNLNLSVKLKKKKFNFLPVSSEEKKLLSNISTSFKTKSVNVIMGPSGSGKTTLLNFLSDRLSKNSSFVSSGEILINNRINVKPKKLAKISAYVTQHFNSLIPTLTVRETLYFQAKLRLPTSVHNEIPSIINTLIRVMGLSDCAETVIGSEFVKGISGGEKRRVTIAIQLLSRPKILFLDEPTSGLDIGTSVAIMKLLDSLAVEYGTTIVTTIHQPSQEMFNRFGFLLLLARGGRTVYTGKASEVLPYLSHMGYNPPARSNVADFILDIVSESFEEDSSVTASRVNHLVSTWENHSITYPCGITESDEGITKFIRKQLPIVIAFPTITKRQFINSIRSKDVLISRMGQTILLGIVHALFFAPLKNSQDGISNRLGLIQEVLNLYFIGLVNNISLYPVERKLFYDEYRDRVYGLSEFSLSYLLNELPTEILPSFFFAAMLVFVCGLPRNASMFFAMFLSSFVCTNCGESLGMMVNSIFDHMALAINLLAGLMTLAIFMGGTMSLHMPEFWKAWNYISPLKYAVGICAKLGFQGQSFHCDGGTCSLTSGQDVLEYYKLDCNLGAYVGALIACLVIYRIVAIGLIYVRIKFFL